MTILDKSLSLSEHPLQWAARQWLCPPTNPPVAAVIEGFDQNCLRQGRRPEHQDWGLHGSMAWRATEAEPFVCSDRWGWGWQLMMLWRSISVWDYFETRLQTKLTVNVIIILTVTKPRTCGTCSVGQVITATLSKMHLWSGWSLAVWFQPYHWAHSTPSSG